MHKPTRPGTRTHTQICIIYCFSTPIKISESASVLRHTNIVCPVYLQRPPTCFLVLVFLHGVRNEFTNDISETAESHLTHDQ